MTDQLDRLTAALADRYALERELGAGGMATVYLAEDLKHHRKVAVKVLRPELAAVLGAERFVQEIETTANLQHPNILPLFDSGQADSFLYYVMPFIEGETLRDRLSRETQLGVDDAVRIASDVAEALDYAHRRDVIHRDIKPENILLQDGRPIVSDFGIALAVSAAGGGRMTETGLSLGTPHYMSPEQATAEKDLTNRSDIYSLGAMLYEMLTGDPPHTGSSAQQIIMKIVTDEPRAVTDFRKSVPPNVASAVAKALQKLPADRFESAALFAGALANPTFASPAGAMGPAVTAGERSRRLIRLLGASLLITVLLAVWGWSRPGSAPESRRFAIPPPRGGEFLPFGLGSAALSPDGETVVFAARTGDSTMLFRRSLNGFDTEVLPGTNDAFYPFFSPDGDWVGFMTFSPRQVRKVPLAGGPVIEIAETGTFWDDALWRSDETIVIVRDNGGLLSVPDRGGELTALTVPDTAAGELQHFGPRELSDGRLMFSIARRDGYRLAVLRDDDQGWDVLEGELGDPGGMRFKANPHYLEEGFFISTNQGVWYAWPFDVRDGRIEGPGVRVLEDAGQRVSLSAGGDVAYLALPPEGTSSLVVRVSRDGVVSQLNLDPGEYRWPRVSPDGTRLAVGFNWTISNIWIVALESGAAIRLPSGVIQSEPVWSPDGMAVAFSSWTDSTRRVGIRAWNADGSGSGRWLFAGEFDAWPSSWSRDGKQFAFYGGPSNNDVWVVELNSDKTLHQVTDLPSAQTNPGFSPDGRWLAYQSDETGQYEVFVVSYPQLSERHLVSRGGGTEPVWSRSGDQLYYRDNRRVMSVDVRTNVTFDFDPPVELVRGPFELDPARDRSYDVSPDGSSFYLLQVDPAAAPELRIVTNWVGELKATVGN